MPFRRACPSSIFTNDLREAEAEQMDSLVNSAHYAGCGEAGRLTVGFYTSISAGNLLATLVDYKKRFSQIDVYLKESSRVRLVTALRNGALDIAIVTSELPLLGNQGKPLWSERILLALLEGHPLAGKDVVYWTDLRGETVLLSQYDPGRELEDLLLSKLVSPEDRPKIAHHDVSRGIIKSLIAAGFGVSLVTESDVGANFSGLTFRELRDGTGPSRVGFSAHWRSDNDNPALANFLKLLGERYPTAGRSRLSCATILANARSVAMNRANIGATSLEGSAIDCPVSRASTSA